MQYRRFGRTNLQMPVFSCGGMRYQSKWNDAPMSEIPEEGQRNLEATIMRSLEVGINHIETARGYGSSEVQLGQVLPKLPRDKMIVQTKVGPSADAKQFAATFDVSMQRLKLEYVDLLAIHGVNDAQTLEWAVKPGGCLEAARKIQKSGRCRWVGFSTHGPLDVITAAVKTEAFGGFDYFNLHWYYIFQHNWPAIVEATKRDMGVFIISPSDKGGKLYDPPAKLRNLTAPLHPLTFNNLFCLNKPQVHTLSIGAARPSDFDEHLDTLPYLVEANKYLGPIEKKLEDAMFAATGVRHPEDMSKGLPSFDKVPGQMNLAIMVWLRNLAVGWDMVEYGKMRYNLLGNGGHWFPGQNAAALETVSVEQVKKVVSGAPYGDKVIDLVREAQAMLGGASVKRLSKSE
jgi:predicted aldo/keto reductase-like oxidoreductase